MEAGTQLDERRDAPDPPGRRPTSAASLMPATRFSSVLLPEPLRPMMPKVFPFATSNVTPSQAPGTPSSGRRSREHTASQQARS